MWPLSPFVRALGMTCLAASVAACSLGPSKDPTAPPIRDVLDKQRAPDESKLPIITSEPIAPDPDKALENYRKLLGLDSDPETRAEARRRIADLQVQVDDIQGENEQSENRLNQAVSLYKKLLKERPLDPRNDRVLYQLARAQQNQGHSDEAIATLKTLTDEYKDSALAGDAHFRRADLLYRLDRYPEAENEFALVMDYQDRTPFFEPAQYMKGWAQYRQSKFDDAIGTFFDVLERELPDPVPLEIEDAIKQVARGKSDLAQDSLRVVSLSFAALGGGEAVSERFAKDGNPRFYPLIYNALGKTLLEKQRYTDAAQAFTAFPTRYPKHTLAPTFQSLVIDAYTQGGFGDLVIREKERYATTYDPDAPYWEGLTPTQDILTALRGHMDDLAKLNHAQAQADKEKNSQQFLVAARWYKRILEVFPDDPKAPEISYLLSDALLDGGKTLEAAKQYTATAYDYPPHAKAGEAALAAFQAYEKHAEQVPKTERPKALREAVDSGLRLAEKYPQHSSKLPVLSQAAEDLYELKSLEEAIEVAGRVLNDTQKAPDVLRRNAWSVTADSQFELKNHAASEEAYAEELKLIPPQAPERSEVVERLAASIYKQGEAAREADDLRAAVDHFLRVGRVTPNSKIRANADYDAASSLVVLEDWPAATRVLESFRTQFPQNKLQADVDKKLALAYESDGKPANAAQAFERIAARSSETPEVRQTAAWQAAKLYDKAELPNDAYRTYETYVAAFPRPVDQSMEARTRLMELANARGDTEDQKRWLRDIIRADQTAGNERTEATRSLAATSSLTLGRMAAAQAKTLRLTAPLEISVKQKKDAMQDAIQALNRAAEYGFAETTTAATFEIGGLYQDFGVALMKSDRPAGLSELELEQYDLLLEEQSYPFEEKAIDAHESNIKRILQGRYDKWIKRSAETLVELSPAQYEKREQREETYDSLR